MSIPNEYPNLDELLTRFASSIKTLKMGMQDDGHIDVDEIISAIPIGTAGRDDIHELLTSIKSLYPEIAKLEEVDPFRLLVSFGPYLGSKFLEVLG
jgi:hypothetical protein